MEVFKDITRIKHKQYGIGVFAGTETKSNQLLYKVVFERIGEKKFTEECFSNGILEILPTEISLSVDSNEEAVSENLLSNAELKQFDKSDKQIGNENVIEAFECSDSVLFNESYIVVGDRLSAKIITASYNLTIFGDLNADEIFVKGNLFVTGSITCNKLHCFKVVSCQKEIESTFIDVGYDIFAESIVCDELKCDGNIFVRTTVNVDNRFDSPNVLFAGEGVVGGGNFIANGAVTKEYFEFDGNVSSRIVELDDGTDYQSNDVIRRDENIDDKKPEELISIAKKKLDSLYSNPDLTENEMVNISEILSISELECYKNIDELFNEIINISYQDRIDDLYTYLKVVYAKKYLPKEFIEYETVSHVFAKLLVEAEKDINELNYISTSIVDIAKSIYIIEHCKPELKYSQDELYDKVFSSIGIRYNTVLRMLKKD